MLAQARAGYSRERAGRRPNEIHTRIRPATPKKTLNLDPLARRTVRLIDPRFVWSVWLTSWRFWVRLPLLVLGGIWMVATIPATPANWINEVCAATGQDQRAATWCASHGYEVPLPVVYGGIGPWPAFVVALLAMLGASIAMLAELLAG
ncbi:MAG: hypothetical protein IPO66_19495 [Rhodanobacteraceae bacterium]|nr:hypothetical protein [Rhodanobacteraceae bacterium]